MALRALLILCGLGIAAWGHLLLGERRLASAAWRRLDDLFPPAWRSSEPLAGGFLLGLGAFCVLVAIAGA